MEDLQPLRDVERHQLVHVGAISYLNGGFIHVRYHHIFPQPVQII
jgi:hypothetical protein